MRRRSSVRAVRYGALQSPRLRLEAPAAHGPAWGALHERRRLPELSHHGRSQTMNDLSAFSKLVPLDHGLCVLGTARANGSIHSCVVNAGVLQHPLTGATVVGLVAAGGTQKLRNLR